MTFSAFFEGVDVDDHDFDIGAGGELAYIGQSGAVVNEIAARGVVVENAEVFVRDLEGFVHAFADGYGRNHDDELGKTEALVQLENRLGVDKRLTGPCLHFHAELFAFQVVAHRQGIALLDGPQVVEHRSVVNEQGVADAVLILQQSWAVIADNGKGGGLFLLADEQVGHGVDGGCLERLFDEFEFHAFLSPFFHKVELRHVLFPCF